MPAVRSESDSKAYIEKLTPLVEQVSQEAKKRLCPLSNEQLLWSPDKKVWSIAHVLDHLNKSGNGLIPRFEEAIKTLEQSGKKSDKSFRYSLGEKMFIRFLSPNPPIKMPVPPGLHPLESPDVSSVLPSFLAMQDQWRALIASTQGLDLMEPKITSPVSSLVKFRLAPYLEGSIMHQLYHWEQIKVLLAHPQFPR